jgi:toxin ParE1/3/4
MAMYSHIASNSASTYAADRFIDFAYGTIEELARMPEMGQRRHFPHKRLSDLRSFRVKNFENYLIFHGTTTDGIEVFHIIHGNRNLDQYWKT